MPIEVISLTAAALLLLILISTSVYTIFLIISWFAGAPYVPTKKKDIEKLLSHVKMKKGELMIDLGCGDGRILRAAAAKYGVRGIGYDVNALVIHFAKIRGRFQNLPLTFERKDIREIDYSQADIIYLYLFPKIILELQERFDTNTKKSVTIISHAFKIPLLEKMLVETIDDKSFKTYVYKRE